MPPPPTTNATMTLIKVIVSVEDHSTEMIADWTRLTTQPRFPNVGPERWDPLARGWRVRPPVRHG